MTANYSRIPEATMKTLQAWVHSGRPVGGFVEAVLCNDLRRALMLADEDNLRAIYDTVAWLLNEAPAISWGSRERSQKWANMHADRRKEAREQHI